MSKASQYVREKRLQKICRVAKRQAAIGVVNYGNAPPEAFRPFTHDHLIDGMAVRIIFTRDGGMHTCGWLKNPDYDRCYHLSVSYRDPVSGYTIPHDKKLSAELCQHLFGADTRLLWVEGPKGPDGVQLDVWHYRLMCDRFWQPIKPRKEVYSKEFTERGWKSYSDIHGRKPLMTQEA